MPELYDYVKLFSDTEENIREVVKKILFTFDFNLYPHISHVIETDEVAILVLSFIPFIDKLKWDYDKMVMVANNILNKKETVDTVLIIKLIEKIINLNKVNKPSLKYELYNKAIELSKVS